MLTKKEYFKMLSLINNIGSTFAAADVIILLIAMTVMCIKGITSPSSLVMILGFCVTVSHIFATAIVDKIFEKENEKYIIETEED